MIDPPTLSLSRRAFFATVIGVAGTPTNAMAAGLHITGVLTANDTGDEGYFALCSTSGKCDVTDTLMIAAHPKSPLMPQLRAMNGKPVQVSIFESK